jgi:lauroyl/myristoyl acyltransferase
MAEQLSTEELVERAHTRVFDPSDLPRVEEPEHLRGLSFSELVAHSRGRAKHVAHDDPHLSRCRDAARHVLGREATEEQVEELAWKSLANRFLSAAMDRRPEECAQATVEGEGLELLQTPGRAAIGAFVHAAPFAVAIYGIPHAMGRPIFVPGLQLPTEPAVLRMRQAYAEEFGLRFITRPPLIETMLALLEAGEVCSFAADQAGSTEATFFGVPVRTKAAAAALALRTGHPIVIVAPWYDNERFGIHALRPIDPKRFSSPAELHQVILRVTEKALAGDFARFVGPLFAAGGSPDPVASGAAF